MAGATVNTKVPEKASNPYAALVMQSSARRKWLIVVGAAAFLLCAFYWSIRVIWSWSHFDVGVLNGSRDEADSRAGGFYLGRYVPTQRVVSLRDGSPINVPDAWLERASKPHLTFLLQDQRVTADGYYLYIPIYPDDVTRSKTVWPFKFGLRLDQERKVSRYPGIPFNSERGFCVFLNAPFDSITFVVEQKEHESDTWNRATPVGTIEFKRAF